tara:strand:- start:181 stop:495 length:315 start_codon:yes stop_codon:yes gene_type:complete
MNTQINWETQIIQEQQTLPKSYNKLIIIDRQPQSVSNPFGGGSCELTPVAVAVYDMIKGCELTMATQLDSDYHYKGIRYWTTIFHDGLSWFRKHYPKEYMILLD